MEDTIQRTRYIAIANLALKRADSWSKEYDNEKYNQDPFHRYFIKKINDEWKHDTTNVTADDYDYVIHNARNLYEGETSVWSLFKGSN